MRVLIIDDSVVVRRLIADMLKENGAVVADMLSSGTAAVRWLEANPNGCDVVVMNVEMSGMSGMSGIDCVRAIRRTKNQIPVVMLSTDTGTTAVSAEALRAGASACIHVPETGSSAKAATTVLANELLPVLTALVASTSASTRAARIGGLAAPLRSGGTQVSPKPSTLTHPNMVTARPQAVVIGSSTGGPEALASMFRSVSAAISVPFVIAQHMPEGFSKLLAERLGRVSNREALLAEEGMIVQHNCVYLAPGGRHLSLQRDGSTIRCHLSVLPNVGIHPSADVLFHSAADVWGSAVLGVVLTGMGSDGLDGSLHLHRIGATVIAQDEATSVVWGMPRAVAEAGVASVMPLSEIADEIQRRVGLV